jgi:hypothetical protein
MPVCSCSEAGLPADPEYDVVATDGTVTDGRPYPESKEFIGGFIVVDVPSREEALEWAAKVAVACRCAQEVREFPTRPSIESGARTSETTSRRRLGYCTTPTRLGLSAPSTTIGSG